MSCGFLKHAFIAYILILEHVVYPKVKALSEALVHLLLVAMQHLQLEFVDRPGITVLRNLVDTGTRHEHRSMRPAGGDTTIVLGAVAVAVV